MFVFWVVCVNERERKRKSERERERDFINPEYKCWKFFFFFKNITNL